MKVIIFSRSNCSACDQLKRYLKERGVEYTDIDGMSPAGRAKMLVNQVFVSYFRLCAWTESCMSIRICSMSTVRFCRSPSMASWG